MIVLTAPQDQVLGALQAVAGLVERRHRIPILENVLNARGIASAYDQFVQLRRVAPVLTRLVPMVPPPIPEFARPPIKLALGRVRELRGFFGATKVNARNAP